jgi:hypothetical protein
MSSAEDPVQVYTGDLSVILCGDTRGFRRLCRTQVHAGDRALDIGCSYGSATQVINCELSYPLTG